MRMRTCLTMENSFTLKERRICFVHLGVITPGLYSSNAVFVSIFCYTSGQGQIEQVNVYSVLYATVEIQCTTPLSSLYLAIPTDRPFSRISLWEFT